MAKFARVFIVLALSYIGGQNQHSSLKCKIYLQLNVAKTCESTTFCKETKLLILVFHFILSSFSPGCRFRRRGG